MVDEDRQGLERPIPCEELETLYLLSYKLPNVLKDAIELEIAERTTRRE